MQRGARRRQELKLHTLPDTVTEAVVQKEVWLPLVARVQAQENLIYYVAAVCFLSVAWFDLKN